MWPEQIRSHGKSGDKLPAWVHSGADFMLARDESKKGI